jgi:hypothetical protein
MAHTQKPDFIFRRNGRVHLNRRGRQFSRLLAGELCTSACRVCTARASLYSAVMWRLLVTHSILFPLHFSSRASPCAITFQLESTAETVEPLLTGAFLDSEWQLVSQTRHRFPIPKDHTPTFITVTVGGKTVVSLVQASSTRELNTNSLKHAATENLRMPWMQWRWKLQYFSLGCAHMWEIRQR